jgi:hypothetical protein
MKQTNELFQLFTTSLNREISLPLWILILTGLLFIILVILLALKPKRPVTRKKLQKNLHLDSYEIQPINNQELKNPASEHEDLVIKILARADGQPVLLERISNQMNASRLRTAQVMDYLQRKGYIQSEQGYNQSICYTLTSMGRDVAIARGYA